MKKHVLFVETEPFNLLLMRRIVERMGCYFSHAADSVSAWENAISHSLDLILLTLDADKAAAALKLVRDLKGHPGLNHIPVVAVVQRQDEALKEKAFLVGCEGFLQKPADIRQIQALLKEFLTFSKPAVVVEEAHSLVAADT